MDPHPVLLQDDGNFYQTVSGVLVGLLIAAVLELRYQYRRTSTLTFVQKLSMTSILMGMLAGGYALAIIPFAILYGPDADFLAQRDHLAVVVLFATVGTVILPFVGLLVEVWRRPSHAPKVNASTPRGEKPPAALPTWLVGSLVVLIALTRRRDR